MSYQVMQQVKTGYIECLLWADSPEDEQGEEIAFYGISEALSSSITDDIEKFISLADIRRKVASNVS